MKHTTESFYVSPIRIGHPSALYVVVFVKEITQNIVFLQSGVHISRNRCSVFWTLNFISCFNGNTKCTIDKSFTLLKKGTKELQIFPHTCKCVCAVQSAAGGSRCFRNSPVENFSLRPWCSTIHYTLYIIHYTYTYTYTYIYIYI